MKIRSISKILLLALVLTIVAFVFCSCDDILNMLQQGSGDGSGDGSSSGGDNSGDNGGSNNSDNNTGDNGADNGSGNTDNSGNSGGPNASTTTNFSVTVLDSDGNFEKKIMVYLYQGDKNTGKVAPISNSNGKAEFKNVPVGEYRVVLKDSTNTRDLTYDAATAVLNSQNTNITITVYNKLMTPTEDIYFLAEDADDALGFPVSDGVYSVDVRGTTYFVFRAAKSGVYTISATGSETIMVKNYGNPQIATLVDEATGSISIEVPPITDDVTPFVIALSSSKNTTAVVKFERTGTLTDPKYMPWNDIQAENAPESVYTLPLGTVLEDLDVFSTDLAVTLGSDGYYYTADGDLVLVRINSDSPYLVSLATLVPGLLESSGAVETFGLYVYDNGEFVRKENYGTVIEAYYQMCDPELGVVPLTEELANIIKLVGDYRGWWNFGTTTGIYIFGETPVPTDTAWLFACCIAK